MNFKLLLSSLVFFFSFFLLQAQDVSKRRFEYAHQEINSMLEGKQALDFEKAIFLTENAYRGDSIRYEYFQSVLDGHSAIIRQLIRNNDVHDWKQFVRGNRGVTPEMETKVKEQYRKALANWAIFTYLTDTLTITISGRQFIHLPYGYSNDDPFATANWENSQVLHLLETRKGNCYALATLFKVFSERFNSDATLVTAPQHIFIEHSDPYGNRFNVEVATRSFPDMGSIQTLTYTTRAALLNDISIRKLDLKQSVGLSLVYLAKGYAFKYKVNKDEFLLTCANTTLQQDPKNLNALLLKAQVYEQRVMKNEMPSVLYEQLLTELYQRGYRQMPEDMRNIILSDIQQTPLTVASTNKTPNPFENIGEQSRYVTLSNGLFEELHASQQTVRYGQTVFDSKKGKVMKFLHEENTAYQVDPVVFALSVDPLAKSFPWYTPYQFAGNNPIFAIDIDGQEDLYFMSGLEKLVLGTNHIEKFNNGAVDRAAESIVGTVHGARAAIEVSRFVGNNMPISTAINGNYSQTQYLMEVMFAMAHSSASTLISDYKNLLERAANGDEEAIGALSFEIIMLASEVDDLRNLKALRSAKGKIPDAGLAESGGSRRINKFESDQNCAGCAEAGDASLKGNPASALDHGVTGTDEVAKSFGKKAWSVNNSRSRIEQRMKDLGDGATAVVFGYRGKGKVGHYFNVVNKEGKIEFLDFQKSGSATMKKNEFDGYKDLWMIDTTIKSKK